MTFFWKFIFPGIWITGFGLGAIGTLISGHSEGIMMFCMWVLAITFMYFTILKAKKVSIDNEYLYINNFRKTIKTPLSNIKKVNDLVFILPRPIIIHFHKPIEFGNKITFIGFTEMMLFFGEHPAVKEIRNRINSNLN